MYIIAHTQWSYVPTGAFCMYKCFSPGSPPRGAPPRLLGQRVPPFPSKKVTQAKPQLVIIRRELHSLFLKAHSASRVPQLIPGLRAAGRDHRIKIRAQRFSFIAKWTRGLGLVEGHQSLFWLMHLQVGLPEQHPQVVRARGTLRRSLEDLNRIGITFFSQVEQPEVKPTFIARLDANAGAEL